MIKEWEIKVECKKSDALEALHKAASNYLGRIMPEVVSKDGMPTLEGAQLGDRLMYQVRQAVPCALNLVGPIGGELETVLTFVIVGTATTESSGSFVSVNVRIVPPEERAPAVTEEAEQ